MNKLFNSLLFALAVAAALPASAQTARVNSSGGNSPHETTSGVINPGRKRVTITYGRPYAKGRVIWGTLVPWDQPWRMGSDEATTLITQQALQIGDATIPAGIYTLYMVPSENGTTKLAFSTKLGGWGIPVDTSGDLVRVDLKKDSLDQPLEQYTMAVKPASSGGTITMAWDKTQYSVAFTLKQ